MHLKKVIQEKKNFFTTQVALCVLTKIFILEYLFLGAFFVTKVSLYLWNLRKILHLLIPVPMKSILGKQILDLYIVHDPKCFDQ
jgi:hypothetical protein